MTPSEHAAETLPPGPVPTATLSLERTLLALLDNDTERQNAVYLLRAALGDIRHIRALIQADRVSEAVAVCTRALGEDR